MPCIYDENECIALGVDPAHTPFYVHRKEGNEMNEQQFEKLLNITTAGFQYGYPKLAKYHRYEPTPYEGLEQLFTQYELPKQAVFVDMGCGKGRVPIYMHYRFNIPSVGVEMDSKFFTEAEHNREQYLKRAKHHVPLVFHHEIAEQYIVKKQDNVFFFFNPFSVHVLRHVMNNIIDSKNKHPRDIHIILYYPPEDYLRYLQDSLQCTMLTEVKLTGQKNPNERIVVFQML